MRAAIALLTLLATSEAVAERLEIVPGFASERLEVRDPAGRVKFYIQESTGGHAVVVRPDGSVAGDIRENSYRRNSSGSFWRRGTAAERNSAAEHGEEDR